jgi:3-hydroxyacyl-CoA dehydrogenase/enoyl-CoA hydratase/3-hydroxybutyryl-CoA epimerase
VTGSAFTVRIERGVAWLELNVPDSPVNKITREVRTELSVLLDKLPTNDAVRAVVLISRKPGTFIAGADIDEFVALRSREEALNLITVGQALINRLAALPVPVVTAIHGTCFGGGLETALACTYRIATDDPKTMLGLPEVQLGIIPAAGGCQRLPRLIGVRAALDLILVGKQVPARRAHRLGMVDELVHPAILEVVAAHAAQRLADGWRPSRNGFDVGELALEKNPLGRRILFRTARKRVQSRTGGNYPAPLAALDAIEHGLDHGIEAGLDMEAAHFAELAVGPVSRNLVRIFFATTALKKDPGVEGDAPEPRTIQNLGIVGAGFMGAGIGAVAAAKANTDVRFKDRDLQAVARGLLVAHGQLRDRFARRRISKYELRRMERLLSGGVGWEGFRRTGLVIEAVFEDLEVKRTVFREAEEHCREDAILASNTSTIPITRIAEALRRPERLLGMHFFSPVEKMPLLEVIVTDRTAPWVTVSAVAFGRAMGKTVIVVRDTPGFWVNRILAPYMNEAGHLLQEGVSIEAIDGTMRRFGFPVGPITLLDEVGLDVAQKAAGVLHEAFGDRLTPVDGIARMVERGRLGRKSGGGFYRYEKGKRRGVGEDVYTIVGAEPRSGAAAEAIERRLVFALLNEAARALDEEVVRAPRDGDIGAVFGFGFPPFHGGPLRYLDTIGTARAVETLERLAEAHGERFTPAPSLRRMMTSGERFYPER